MAAQRTAVAGAEQHAQTHRPPAVKLGQAWSAVELGGCGSSARAEARGKKGGRNPVVTPDKLARARTHLAAGLTVREAAARVKVGKTALYEALGASATGAGKLSSRSVRA